jgi:predicted nucleotide-binding protein
MSKKKTDAVLEKEKTYLCVSHNKAKEMLTERIQIGQEIERIPINSKEDLDIAEEKINIWNSYNRTMLIQMFSTDEIIERYSSSHVLTMSTRPKLFNELIIEFKSIIKSRLRVLRSTLGEIDLFTMKNYTDNSDHSTIDTAKSNKVFIVHGHDEKAKEVVARFITTLHFEPIILREMPNEGKGILEKLEHNSSDVAFAVVLLTPDDIGRKKRARKINEQKRARQNVIFELGYFIAKLERHRVVALVKDNIELPSDFNGIVYIKMDDRGAWKIEICKEMNAAGMDPDTNMLIKKRSN